MTIPSQHPSYGMISVTRQVASKGIPLFGSSIRHSNIISIQIYRAEHKRDLNRAWYHRQEPIVEVCLSPTQFTDMLTNMNTEGIPCTLVHVGDDTMPACPAENIRETFTKEFNQDLQESLGDIVSAVRSLKTALNERIPKKSTINQALEKLDKMERDMTKNFPFVAQQFHRQMDKSVTEGIGEIEGFFQSRIHSLGSSKLVEELEKGILTHQSLITLQEEK